MRCCLLLLLLITNAFAQRPTVLISGRVMGYVTNPIGDYDGLRLQPSAGEAVALRFPPHAAGSIIAIGPIGQRVDAESIAPHDRPNRGDEPAARPDREERRHDRGRMKPYRLIRLRQADTGPILDLRHLPPPPPQSGERVQTTGSLTGTLTDERGRLVGLLIDKMYLLELRPHQSDLLRALLTPADRIGFSGYQRPAAGFVNQTGRAVIRPLSLTIAGKTYAF